MPAYVGRYRAVTSCWPSCPSLHAFWLPPVKTYLVSSERGTTPHRHHHAGSTERCCINQHCLFLILSTYPAVQAESSLNITFLQQPGANLVSTWGNKTLKTKVVINSKNVLFGIGTNVAQMWNHLTGFAMEWDLLPRSVVTIKNSLVMTEKQIIAAINPMFLITFWNVEMLLHWNKLHLGDLSLILSAIQSITTA